MRTSLSALVLALSTFYIAGCDVYVRDPAYDLGSRRRVVAVAGPRLVLIEGTSIKYCPDEDEDLFFYGGVWYVFRGGLWYRSARHTGPWKGVAFRALPGSFGHIPMGRFKHHHGNWHPARGQGGDEPGSEGEGHGRKRGHDKDGDGVDDHRHKHGKGHGDEE